MKSRYLILQIDIGQGTQWGNNKTINPIREFFIPSVQKYCQKYSYDYKLIEKSVYEQRYEKFDFLATKNKHYSFERYFHFENSYDYTIYIDNDVYIFPDAQKLPKIHGLMNVREPEGNSSKIFREVNNLPDKIGYYNSGVTFCDKLTATKLSNYMIKRLNKKINAKGKNSDNMLLNEFVIENKNKFQELGSEWNYMPFLPNFKEKSNPNFFHFVGILGKQILNKLQDNQKNIFQFLQEFKK